MKGECNNMSDFKQYLNVYEFKTILPGSGQKIQFKPITTGELKRLLVYENESDERVIEEALDQLISSSVQNEDFNIKDLYLQDRFFLLVEIRKKTKGAFYKFTYECGSCRAQTLHNLNLDELVINKFPDDVSNSILLTDNISVKVKHITRQEQIDAYKEFNGDGMSSLQISIEMALLTHAAGIYNVTTPNGIEDIGIGDKKFLLENISTGSYELIKDWYVDNNFGMDFTFEINCNGCGKKEKHDIPLHNFFF